MAVTAAAFLFLAFADGGFERGVWAQATILAWWTVLVALIAGASPRRAVPRGATVVGLALFGLAAMSGLSILWSLDPGGAYADALRAAGYAGLFVLAAIVVRAGGGRDLLAGLAIGLVALACVSLLTRLQPGLATGADVQLALEVSGGRLSYPLGYWNGLGAAMAAAVPLLVWLAVAARRRVWRAGSLAALPVVVLTLFFSGSRGGVAAAVIGLVALMAIGPRRVPLAVAAAIGLGAAVPLVGIASASSSLVNGLSTAEAAAAGDRLLALVVVACAAVAIAGFHADRWIARRRLPVIGIRSAAVAVAAVSAAGLLIADPVERLGAVDATPQEVTASEELRGTRFASLGSSGRLRFWEAAWRGFGDAPLEGLGAGSFGIFWNLHGSLDVSVEHAHSLFFESAAELGIVGLLLALAVFGVPASSGIRRRLAATAWADPEAARGTIGAGVAVLAAGAVTAAVDWTWDLPASFVAVIVAAALLTALPSARDRAPGRGELRSATAALALAALISIAASGVLLVSERDLERSRESAAAGDLEAAAERARASSDLLPFAISPSLQLASVERTQGNYRAAQRAIDAAQEDSASDWRLWWVEAGIAFEAGRIGDGIWALNRAKSLNPRAPSSLFEAPSAAR